jgi:diacylglycerol kinase (ATP)
MTKARRPPPAHADGEHPAQAQKARRGVTRWLHAAGYSLAGLRAGWTETAFRQEALAAVLLVPAAFYVGRNWAETALLAGSVVGVMVVELLNTAIESVVDRVGPERHPLSKRAKDLASAAVLLSLLLAAGTWLAALYTRFVPG